MLKTTDELKDRVEAKRHELQAKLVALRADARHEAIAGRKEIERSLAELEGHIKDGWERVSDAVKTKLDEWLQHN